MVDAIAESSWPDAGRLLRAFVPILLLVVAVGAVFALPLFGGVQAGESLPDVSVSHVTLPHDEEIVLHVTNNGPDPVTISQILVDEAYWDFTVGEGGTDSATLAPLESTTITIPYHWTPGWDLHVKLVLENGATFGHDIIAPQPEPGITADLLWTLAVIGLLVGVIPVALGMLWFLVMRDMSQSALHGVLALAAGVLTFLAFDSGLEALTVAAEIPGAFEGRLLVITAAIGTLLVIQAVSAALRDGGELSPLKLAYLVALAIGLHNLAEGLAIGGAFALGRASLGAFLVVGFMIHNITEGPAVVAPLAEGSRPRLVHFGVLGALAGAPVILGGWVGSLATAPTVGAVFLAAGVGAILQVNWEIAGMIRSKGQLTAVAPIIGFLIGLFVMYATDLLVAL